MPGLLKFEHDCLTILRSSLLAVAPEEGCALLLGYKKTTSYWGKRPIWHVLKIWSCSNAWNHGLFKFSAKEEEQSKKDPTKFSKENRFALNPKDQFDAQRWARKNHLEVLGVAHSHPKGDARPSEADLRWGMSPGLMVIVSNTEEVRAWWQSSVLEKKFHELELIGNE